jgi:DNA-binding GntR family transcriptional regulator
MALYVHARRPRTRRSSSRCCKPAIHTPALSNTKAMGTAEKEHAHLIVLCRAQEIDEACRFLEQHIEAVRTDLLRVVGGGSIGLRAG